jgi:cytochrome c
MNGETPMKSIYRFSVAVGLGMALLAAGTAGAAEKGTRNEATTLVKKAIEFYKVNGKEKAYAEISKSSGEFIDRDMYVYVVETSGVVVAHGANSKLIGKNLGQIKDVDGKLFVQDLMSLVKDNKSGWVDYKWPNPLNKQIESKTTYLEPFDGVGFAVGVYK